MSVSRGHARVQQPEQFCRYLVSHRAQESTELITVVCTAEEGRHVQLTRLYISKAKEALDRICQITGSHYPELVSIRLLSYEVAGKSLFQ